MAHRVTIGIPTIGRLPYLKEAAASVLAQTYPHVELLISDNMAAPEVQAWGRELCDRDARVRYRRHERRVGLAQNWNTVVDAASGESLMVMGDDDRLLPGFVETLVAPIAAGIADVSFCNHHIIDTDGQRRAGDGERMSRIYGRATLAPGPIADPEAVVWGNTVPIATSLIRTDWMRRHRFNEELNTPEIEAFLRMARDGARFHFSPEYLAEYRVHATSETARGLRNDRLADSLLPLPVAPHLEGAKAGFLGPILADATKWSLRRGDFATARRYVGSPYYPRPRNARQWFVKWCARAPRGVARVFSALALSHLPLRD